MSLNNVVISGKISIQIIVYLLNQFNNRIIGWNDNIGNNNYGDQELELYVGIDVDFKIYKQIPQELFKTLEKKDIDIMPI